MNETPASLLPKPLLLSLQMLRTHTHSPTNPDISNPCPGRSCVLLTADHHPHQLSTPSHLWFPLLPGLTPLCMPICPIHLLAHATPSSSLCTWSPALLCNLLPSAHLSASPTHLTLSHFLLWPQHVCLILPASERTPPSPGVVQHVCNPFISFGRLNSRLACAT